MRRLRCWPCLRAMPTSSSLSPLPSACCNRIAPRETYLHYCPSSYLFSNINMAVGRPFDLPYSVLWDDADLHVEELIALTGDHRVAQAAFDEAVKCRPGRIVTLRQKTRLLADSRKRS